MVATNIFIPVLSVLGIPIFIICQLRAWFRTFLDMCYYYSFMASYTGFRFC